MVQEIVRRLGAHQRVLDLGCATGSFQSDGLAATVIRADLDTPARHMGDRFVQCDARQLPFAEPAFDAVILNHSLEHFENPANVLSEIRRVIRKPGYLWIAVPDASTMTDRLYRWLGRGGGHVNLFTDVDALVRLVQEQTGLPHVGTRLLFSSLAFMNRQNNKGRKPRRIYLVGGGSERLLRLSIFLFRKIDALFGTRISVYGWACCFGSTVEFDPRPWSNVCVRCGSGHASDELLKSGRTRRGVLGPRYFCCPSCGVENYFTNDSAYLGMR